MDSYLHGHGSASTSNHSEAAFSGMMTEGQTLDEIISQNNQEMLRRRTYQPPYRGSDGQDTAMRRSPMLEFGSSVDNGLADFQFDPNPAADIMPDPAHNMGGSSTKSPMQCRMRPRDDMAAESRFVPQMSPTYDMFSDLAPYHSNLLPTASGGVGDASQYQHLPMDLSLEVFEHDSVDVMAMNPHSTDRPIVFSASPIEQKFSSAYPQDIRDPGGGPIGHEDETLSEKVQRMAMPGPGIMRPVQPTLPSASPRPRPRDQDSTVMRSVVQYPKVKARGSPAAKARPSQESEFNPGRRRLRYPAEAIRLDPKA